MSGNVLVKVKVTPGAILPSRGTPGAAGADLSALEDVTLLPGETKLIKTGLAMAIPAGYVGLVCSRSGLALKKSVFVLNAPGVVDADYRGDVGVILHNAGLEAFQIQPGDRVAQLLIMDYHPAGFEEVESLDETERGLGGFGSTGVAQQ